MTAPKIRKLAGIVLTCFVVMAFLQTRLRADTTGAILGAVRDAGGAAVPGVAVTVANVETNLHQTALSDTSGDYRFLALPVGTYTVEATHSGFRKFVAGNVVL